MMLNLLRAEVRKILGHRGLAVLLVWLWPVGGMLLPLILLVLALFPSPSADRRLPIEFRWTDVALGAWAIPTNLVGRFLFIALAAAIFSGEYQWSTWKNLVPRADRARLLLAKYLAFAALTVFAFGLTSLLLPIGMGAVQAVRGLPYPPRPTPDVVQTFIGNYLVQVALTVLNTMIGVSIAALSAMLTRSILGGIIGGTFFVFGEIGLVTALIALGIFLHSPQIADAARFTSAINIANISSWVQYGQPVYLQVQGTGTNSLVGSFVILLVWLIVLVGIMLTVFQRQDLM
jgi:ABC-type transport system involved in multi-copper enzyme maturation permease subunit